MGYGGKTHKTDSQNSGTTASSGRDLYYLQFTLQAASPETFEYTLVSPLQINEDYKLQGQLTDEYERFKIYFTNDKGAVVAQSV
jgi:hypothetical protein